MDLSVLLSEWGYWGLFIASFLSGSIIPFSSEAILSIVLIQQYDPFLSVLSATIGNWLGGVTCYYLGYLGKSDWIHKYLRISQETIDKTVKFLQGKGSLIGFFGFLPAIGDVFVVALGLMRANQFGSLFSLLIGKLARYCFIVFLIDKIQLWFHL